MLDEIADLNLPHFYLGPISWGWPRVPFRISPRSLASAN